MSRRNQPADVRWGDDGPTNDLARAYQPPKPQPPQRPAATPPMHVVPELQVTDYDKPAPRASGPISTHRARRPSQRGGVSLTPGGQIGRYILLDKLGQGSFGLVFTGRDTVLDRAVAIKVLNPAHQYNADLLRRFLQEALASARVVHPGIVTVHDYGMVPTGADGGETAYIVLELLQGESLLKRLERTGRFQVPWAIEIARQVSSALDTAHKVGVLHRDLKSENIYLVPDPAAVNGERVKVLDFGLAKVGPSQHTQMNTVFGTPRYMSPEQCRSAASIDERSDIYSLGCILFELVTGRTPFQGELRQQLEGHQRTPAPRASSFNPEVTAELDDLIAQMLAKDPRTRPQSMSDLQSRLYALNAAALAQPANKAQIPGVVPHVPVASPGVAATILPTAASMIADHPAATAAHLPVSPAALANQQVQFHNAHAESLLPPLLPPIAELPQPAQAVAVNHHLAAHLPSTKRSPVRAGIAGAAIAFLIAALLTAVAARGHMKRAEAEPTKPPAASTGN